MANPRMFSSAERWLLNKLHDATGNPPVRMALADGPAVGPAEHEAVASLTIRDRRTLARIVLNPEVEFGDCYADGSVKIEGGLAALLDAVYASMSARRRRGWYQRLSSLRLRLAQRNSRNGSRHNIHHHYDLGNEFY